MITITNRDGLKVAQVLFHGEGGLIARDDNYSEIENSFLSRYEFTIDKTNDDISNIEIGFFAFVKINDRLRGFEILEIDEDNYSKTFYCLDGGLDLNSELKGPYQNQGGKNIVDHINWQIYDSGWEVNDVEIPLNTREFEWTGWDTITKRLLEIAQAFDVFLEFDYILDDTRIVKRFINIRTYKTEIKSRLVFNEQISNIKRNINIDELGTAIYIKNTKEDGVFIHADDIPEEDRGQYAFSLFDDHILVDMRATMKWGRHGREENYDYRRADGYILRNFDTELKGREGYLDAKKELERLAQPIVTYEVSVDYLTEPLKRGDTVLIVDSGYKPEIVVTARVSAVQDVSLINKKSGKIIITNAKETGDRVDSQLKSLSEELKSQRYDFNKVPYVLTVTSSNGTVFKTGQVETTLTARVTKNDIDVTNRFSKFSWSRVSAFDEQNTTKDATYNENHKNENKATLKVTNSDIEVGATFFCHAYIGDEEKASGNIHIKDLTFTTYHGKTAPQNPEMGSIWIDESSLPYVQKIYMNGQWVKVLDENSSAEVLKPTVELIEKQLKEMRDEREQALEHMKAEALAQASRDWQKAYEAFKAEDKAGREEAEKRLLETAERVILQSENFGQFKKQYNFIDSNIAFDNNGITIGKVSKDKDGNAEIIDSAVQIRPDRISMFSGQEEVMYITGGTLYINKGVFVTSLQIGRYTIEKYSKNDDMDIVRYMGSGVRG